MYQEKKVFFWSEKSNRGGWQERSYVSVTVLWWIVQLAQEKKMFGYKSFNEMFEKYNDNSLIYEVFYASETKMSIGSGV